MLTVLDARCAAQGRYINEATRNLPVIGDGDTGYGNALNVKRTVRGYAAAGFAGACSHEHGVRHGLSSESAGGQ